jgi:SH3 domain protein
MFLKYVGLLTIFLSATVMAETAYVTDNLRLGLHQAADTSDRAFRTLESGQELEVLDRDRNYAHVRLPDGVEGHLKAAYLVFDKPARLIVAETQARVEQLEQELAETQEAFAVPGATIAALKQEVVQGQAQLESQTAQVTELTAENEKYRDRHDQFKYSLPLLWVAGAMAVCLLCGFLGGLWLIDRKSRSRHGGFRVY